MSEPKRLEKSKKRWIALIAVVLAASCIAVSILLFQGRLPLRTLTCPGRIEFMRFSPDGRLLATAVHGKGIMLWDARRWTLLRILPGAFSRLDFLPDGRSLITYSLHGGPGAEAVNRGDGLTMAQWKQFQNSIQGRLQRWDIASGQATATYTMPLSGDEDTSVLAHLAVIFRSVPPTGISVLDIRNGHEIHFLPRILHPSAVISPDGRWLCLFDYEKDTLTLWDTQTWQHRRLPFPGGVEDADFSPDGRWLGVASSGMVTLWSVADWRQGSRFVTGYNNVDRLGFTLDSKQVIAGGAWATTPEKPPHMAVTVWNIATGRKAAVLDNQYVADWKAASRGILTHDAADHMKNVLWDSWTGQRLWQGQVVGWPEAAISPDGRTLVTTRFDGSHPSDEQDTSGFLEVRHLPGS